MTILIALVDEYQQRGCLDRVIKSFTESETSSMLESLSQFIHDIRYTEIASNLIGKLICKNALI